MPLNHTLKMVYVYFTTIFLKITEEVNMENEKLNIKEKDRNCFSLKR